MIKKLILLIFCFAVCLFVILCEGTGDEIVVEPTPEVNNCGDECTPCQPYKLKRVDETHHELENPNGECSCCEASDTVVFSGSDIHPILSLFTFTGTVTSTENGTSIDVGQISFDLSGFGADGSLDIALEDVFLDENNQLDAKIRPQIPEISGLQILIELDIVDSEISNPGIISLNDYITAELTVNDLTISLSTENPIDISLNIIEILGIENTDYDLIANLEGNIDLMSIITGSYNFDLTLEVYGGFGEVKLSDLIDALMELGLGEIPMLSELDSSIFSETGVSIIAGGNSEDTALTITCSEDLYVEYSSGEGIDLTITDDETTVNGFTTDNIIKIDFTDFEFDVLSTNFPEDIGLDIILKGETDIPASEMAVLNGLVSYMVDFLLDPTYSPEEGDADGVARADLSPILEQTALSFNISPGGMSCDDADAITVSLKLSIYTSYYSPSIIIDNLYMDGTFSILNPGTIPTALLPDGRDGACDGANDCLPLSIDGVFPITVDTYDVSEVGFTKLGITTNGNDVNFTISDAAGSSTILLDLPLIDFYYMQDITMDIFGATESTPAAIELDIEGDATVYVDPDYVSRNIKISGNHEILETASNGSIGTDPAWIEIISLSSDYYSLFLWGALGLSLNFDIELDPSGNPGVYSNYSIPFPFFIPTSPQSIGAICLFGDCLD